MSEKKINFDFLPMGEKIEMARKGYGLSQKDFGLALGYPLKSASVRIAQYESGQVFPKKETLEKMAAILNVSVIELGYSLTVGERISRARQTCNFSQKHLGDITMLGEDIICKFETGEKKPKYNNVCVVANALNVDPLSLYGVEKEKVDTSPQNTKLLNEVENLEKENATLKAEIRALQGRIQKILKLAQETELN